MIPALYLRSVSVLSIAFHRHMCHRWPCMLLNLRCTVFSNPRMGKIFQILGMQVL